LKVTVLPCSSVTTMLFFSGSNFKFRTWPVFLSRTTMVPAESLLEIISTSGFAVTASLATARPGFFCIKFGSNPDCFALCTTSENTTMIPIMHRAPKPTNPPTIHKTIFAPLPAPAGGAGGPPAGGCGVIDGVEDMRISFLNVLSGKPKREGDKRADIIRALPRNSSKLFTGKNLTIASAQTLPLHDRRERLGIETGAAHQRAID